MVRRLVARYALGHVDELRWQVSRTPLVAVGAALVIGLAAGGSKHASRFVSREAVQAAIAVVGSLLFGVAKKAAVQAAREWMEQRAY
jgi:hypothetical protein